MGVFSHSKKKLFANTDFKEFTKEMKSDYIILAPDIIPVHTKLLVPIFKMYGYNLQILHDEGKEVIESALKVIHNDMCYPSLCALGQLLYAIQSNEFDPHKVAFALFQTGGGCRASNYIWILRKALKDMNLDFIPVISVNFFGVEKHSGFKITFSFFLKVFFSFVYGDMLLLLKNQVHPYEKNNGETDTVVEKWVNKLVLDFKKNRGLTFKSLKKNLFSMVKDFDSIERENKKLIKVGIVGEIYVKYSPFGNNYLEKFLLNEGCEIMIPGLLPFFQAMFMNIKCDKKYYDKPRRKSVLIANILIKLMEKLEGIMIEAVKKNSSFIPPFPFKDTINRANNIIDTGVKMGEGWLLPGEIAELISVGYNNIISVQPFGCLPNHIVAKGTAKKIKELYPQSNIVPIDFDAGASRVNQENRIKLMLSMAEL